MGRILVIAALVIIGVVAAALLGTLIERAQRRLAPPGRLPAAYSRRKRLRDGAIGLAILAGLVLLGFLIQAPG
ncbi:hypothetical protein [Zavarzinia compransoris]|uniref:Uncharacterized protein n=1 Tax=Zavarzinia compransoris TaxID=1264899 RepID=A0A317E307_9PROT|nr:hypothetical protein [Zavarzinia compransoris]PWR19763.1 hypothetical protein DKG75_14975 [Zavarzinia compransoris]TDP45135.1 hypothetical protein DES42_106358 [Zavarzinia compransoris]